MKIPKLWSPFLKHKGRVEADPCVNQLRGLNLSTFFSDRKGEEGEPKLEEEKSREEGGLGRRLSCGEVR